MLLLLVDSDAPSTTSVSQQLRDRGLRVHSTAADDDLHLMVQVETWLLADAAGLARAFPHARLHHVPTTDLEDRTPQEVLRTMNDVVRVYEKSDGLLRLHNLDHKSISERCPSAGRFFNRLRNA